MISIKNIKKDFGSLQVLKGISIDFPSKGLFFLMGKSGAGKTTLLNILATFVDDYEGEYYFEDKEISKLSKKELNAFLGDNISYGFQDNFLLENETVYQNLLLAFYALGESNKAIINEMVDAYLKSFELSDKKDALVINLSGGEKARVSLIRTLIKPAKVYLIDEPTSDLDSLSSKLVYKALKSRATESLVIVVTHNVFDAKMYSDKILYLQDGLIDRIVDNVRIDDFDLYVDDHKLKENCEDLTMVIDNVAYNKSFSIKKSSKSSNEENIDLKTSLRSSIKFKDVIKQSWQQFRKNIKVILGNSFLGAVFMTFLFVLANFFTFPKTQYYKNELKNNPMDSYELYYAIHSEDSEGYAVETQISSGEFFEEKIKENKYYEDIEDSYLQYIQVGNNGKLVINKNESFDGVRSSRINNIETTGSVEIFGTQLEVHYVDTYAANYSEVSYTTITSIKNSSTLLNIPVIPITTTYISTATPDYIEDISFSSTYTSLIAGSDINSTSEVSEIIISLEYAERLLGSSVPLTKEDVIASADKLLKLVPVINTHSPIFKDELNYIINLSEILGKTARIVGICEDNTANIYLDSANFNSIKEKYFSSYYYDGSYISSSVDIDDFAKFLSSGNMTVEGFAASYQLNGIVQIISRFKGVFILVGVIFLGLAIAIIVALYNALKRKTKKRNTLLISLGMNKKMRLMERLLLYVLVSLAMIVFSILGSIGIFYIIKSMGFIYDGLFILNIIPFAIVSSFIIITEFILWIIDFKYIDIPHIHNSNE